MGLQRFERRLERLVEGGFGKAFRSGLQPVEIGRRLVRELDTGRTLGVRGTVVPNHFTVHVSEADFERFEGFHDALVTELTDTVRDSARESHYHFVGPVEVSVVADPRRRHRRPPRRRHDRRRRRRAGATLVLPDGKRIELGDDPVRSGGSPTARSRSPIRRCRVTTQSSGGRAGLRGRRPRLAQRHLGERHEGASNTRWPTAT
jgi:hypothetical protein